VDQRPSQRASALGRDSSADLRLVRESSERVALMGLFFGKLMRHGSGALP